MTGFQSSMSHDILTDLILTTFYKTKTIRFIQFSLRSATDIFKKGGDLTQTLSEKDFNLVYDNRREVIEPSDPKTFFHTKPFLNKIQCQVHRKLSKLHKHKYSERDFIKSSNSNKTSFEKICIRMIIRILFQRPDVLGIDVDLKMTRSLCQQILNSIQISVTLNYISREKSKPFILNSVPTVEKTLLVLSNLAIKFPSLNRDMILRK